MSTTPSPSETPLAQAHRLALASLREMGMEIASRLHAHSQEPDADLGEVATKFARVARAVRQTIALEARLEADAQRHAQAAAAGPDADNEHTRFAKLVAAMGVAEAEARQRTAENKFEAWTLVRRAARKVPGLTREGLEALDERLDLRLEIDSDDMEFRPSRDMAQTIAGICADLGLSPDWGGLSNLDWGSISLETRSALTGEAMSDLPDPLYQRDAPRTLPQRSLPTPEWWSWPPEELPSFASRPPP